MVVWTSQPSSYSLVAVGGGLVCISDGHGYLKVAQRICVLNPVTQTCRMVPKVPFPPLLLWKDTYLLVHLNETSMAVAALESSGAAGNADNWVLATYNLDAGGGGPWTVAQVPVRLLPGDGDAIIRSRPDRVGHWVWCQGKSYCFHERRVYVHARGEDGGLVETAQVATPSTTTSDSEEYSYEEGESVSLVECQGRVFFVALVLPDREAGEKRSCGIWMLSADCVQWHNLAALERQEVDELTGFRYAHLHLQAADRALAAGDLLCLELHLWNREEGAMGKRVVMVGFNMETSEWEVVHDHDQRHRLVGSPALQLMPNSFLF